MLTLLRLAGRELRHQRAFATFFVVNLALGLAGSMTLDGLQGSIARTLSSRSRSFLGAEVRVSSSRPLADEEVARFDAAAAPTVVAELVQTYSMVLTPATTRLAEIRAVDESFPPYGRFVLERAGAVDDAMRAELVAETVAWIDPVLFDQLGIELGDSVRIGTTEFRVTDTIVRDSGLSVRAASLAPRIYVGLSHMAATGLIQMGSRIEYQRLYALGAGSDSRTVARALRATVTDPRVNVISHEEATEQISGAYQRVTRYLGLISLVALTLAGVACAYLFRAFLAQRLVELGILVSLGARRARAQGLLLLELGLLCTVSAIVAACLASVALPLLGRALRELLPTNVELGLTLAEIAPTLAVALMVGPLCCLPLLVRLRSLRPAELFQEHVRLTLQKGRREILWYTPAVLLLLALAAARTGDLREAAAFVALVTACFAFTAGCGRLILEGISRIRPARPLAVRLALRQLAPRRRASLTAFVAVALCALLLGLPPQLRALLDARLQPPRPEDIPSLFLFDIQPEQVDPLREHLGRAGTTIQRMAPMVRARLDAINDTPVERTAGAGDAAGFRDRTRLAGRRYNLTYQAELAATEQIVAGRPFSGEYSHGSDGAAEMSMEVDFAERLGVGLGDVLRFDIQGVPVEGRIVNLRSVDWNSMQPNFFVSFQPGVLEAAPAVFLASVGALNTEKRGPLQASIVESFPNVSMIDVTRGVERIVGLLDQLQWAITATAVTSLAVGLVLVFAVSRDEAQARRWDVNLLKILGARHRLLRFSIDVEFGVLGFFAALVGCAASALASVPLAAGPLDVAWSLAWRPLAIVVVALPVVSALAARIAMRRVLIERPLALLR